MHPISEGQPRTQRPSLLMDLLTGDLGSRAHMNRAPAETSASHITAAQSQLHPTHQSNISSAVKASQSSQAAPPNGTHVFSVHILRTLFLFSLLLSFAILTTISRTRKRTFLRSFFLFPVIATMSATIHCRIHVEHQRGNFHSARGERYVRRGAQRRAAAIVDRYSISFENPKKEDPELRLRSMRPQASRIRYINVHAPVSTKSLTSTTVGSSHCL